MALTARPPQRNGNDPMRSAYSTARGPAPDPSDVTPPSSGTWGGGAAAGPATTVMTSSSSGSSSSSNMAGMDQPGKVRFLMELAARFERDGNASEAVKSAETALLLRRSLPEDAQALFATTLAQHASDVVIKCNALGVQQFQNDAFPLAEFVLNKALFLTDDAKATNCFGPMEHERLRLRAATFNNLGCMEKRRGQLQAALGFLHRAAEIEALVDPDTGASPSTQLNLCTLLNKLGRHAQAAAAAERAVRNLQHHMQVGGGSANSAMLLMGHYNLGVSHEFQGGRDDLARARSAYAACLVSGRRLGVAVEESPALQQAVQALERVDRALGTTTTTTNWEDSSQPPATPPTAAVQGGKVSAGAGLHAARSREGSVASSSAASNNNNATVNSHLALRRPPPQARGIMTAPVGAQRGGNASSTAAKPTDAIARHRERMQLKNRRREQVEAQRGDALRRAQLAHDRERNEKLRVEQEIAAKQRDELARAMYEQMENGIRADRIKLLNRSATKIQVLWRGYLVRAHLRDMAVAVVRLQAVVRSHLCRLNIRRAEARALEDEQNRQLMQTRHAAAATIQRRARQFLRRCNLVRSHRARNLRRYHCQRRIVRAYRAYRQRIDDRVREKQELEQRAITMREQRHNEAARKIQTMYRSYRSRRFMRVVRQEQHRRNEAATRIQAAMRGSLTRAWFKHYRLYRRQQELSTVANLRSVVRIQCAWRVGLAKRKTRMLLLQKRQKEHVQRLFVSARRIQCAWRSFIARGIAFDRRRVKQRREAAATTIQRRWAAFLQRRRFLWHRNELRLQRAVVAIQRWYRAMAIRKRHVETAKYHARMLRAEREHVARTYLALTVSTALRYVVSARVMQQKLASYKVRDAAAREVQRIGRGGLSRLDTAALQRVARLVARNDATRARANNAARVIQRAVRVFAAKERANHMRRAKWAAVRIQAFWRMIAARAELRRLRKIRDDRARDVAARKIQKSYRLHRKRRELQDLEAYYQARRRHKLREQRRIEATTAIQAHWRGHATRRATADARQRLLQQTVQVIRIQRAWRTHLCRRAVNEEIARRQRQRQRRQAAAVKVQSFWRRVLASEYVALVRERHFVRTVAAICIQCLWRRARARMEVARRRETRQTLQRLTAERHDSWVLCCTLIQTLLRARRDAASTVELHEISLQRELEQRQRLAFLRKVNAAVKIQAIYRGHYERCYARGVRAEARAREAARKAREALERRAAVRIQCAFRSHRARVRTAELQTAKRLRRLEEEAEHEEKMDPALIVKNMFWAHEAHLKRDLTRERQERHERRVRAAITMQRIVRGFVHRRRFLRRVRDALEHKAACRIQTEWLRHRAAVADAERRRRERAATKIQSVARMYAVRKQWPTRRRRLDAVKSSTVQTEERQDRAATRIQAVWRGHRARDTTLELLENRDRDKARRVRHEAARMIQKHVRRLIARNRVDKLRFERLRLKRQQPQQQPPARLTSSSSSAAVADDEGSAAPPPVPPPRRSTQAGVVGKNNEEEQQQDAAAPPRAPAPPRVPRPPSGGPSAGRRPPSASAGM